MDILQNVVILVSAYLLGSIPVGLLLVRATVGKDVRRIGSGRIGGTNVLRAAGPWVAALSILGDFGKGWLAVWLAQTLATPPVVAALAGALAVLGHNHSVFIGFKGGVGAITTLGGAIALHPWSIPILIAVGIIAIVLTRHASVGSICVALLLPIILVLGAWWGDLPWAYLVHGLGAMTLMLWALRPNIRRLREGNERRVTLRKTA